MLSCEKFNPKLYIYKTAVYSCDRKTINLELYFFLAEYYSSPEPRLFPRFRGDDRPFGERFGDLSEKRKMNFTVMQYTWLIHKQRLLKLQLFSRTKFIENNDLNVKLI